MIERNGRPRMGLKMKSNPPSLSQSRIVVLSMCHIYTAVDVLAYMRIFFVYVPGCVWRAPIVQASDKGLRDVRGRRGFNRAGQSIINHGWLVDTHVT
jgi:hypothetical protein